MRRRVQVQVLQNVSSESYNNFILDIVTLPPPPRPATAYYNPTQEQPVATTAHSTTARYEEFGDFVASSGDSTEGTTNWTKF